RRLAAPAELDQRAAGEPIRAPLLVREDDVVSFDEQRPVVPHGDPRIGHAPSFIAVGAALRRGAELKGPAPSRAWRSRRRAGLRRLSFTIWGSERPCSLRPGRQRPPTPREAGDVGRRRRDQIDFRYSTRSFFCCALRLSFSAPA